MTQSGAQFLLFGLGFFLAMLGGALTAGNLRRIGTPVLVLGILFMLPALFTLLNVALLGGTP